VDHPISQLLAWINVDSVVYRSVWFKCLCHLLSSDLSLFWVFSGDVIPVVQQQFWIVNSGPGQGSNRTNARSGVPVCNTPQPSTWGGFNGNLPTCHNRADYQRLSMQVYQLIHIRLLCVQFDTSISSNSYIQQPMISFCMFWSLWYRLIHNVCCSYHILYHSVWRRSIILLCTQRSARCLHYQICKIHFCWLCIDVHFQNAA